MRIKVKKLVVTEVTKETTIDIIVAVINSICFAVPFSGFAI